MGTAVDASELVQRCLSGDREAQGQFYVSYLPLMRKVASMYLHSKDDIDDVVHDAFLIALSSLDSLRKPTRIDSWLSAIVRNLSLQVLKLSKSQSLEDNEMEIADDCNEEEGTKSSLTWEILSNFISKLPEGYGAVFRLAVLDGLSHREIAELLGIAPHSSSSQLFHAKAALRKLIREYWAADCCMIILMVGLGFMYFNKFSVDDGIEQTTLPNTTNLETVLSSIHSTNQIQTTDAGRKSREQSETIHEVGQVAEGPHKPFTDSIANHSLCIETISPLVEVSKDSIIEKNNDNVELAILDKANEMSDEDYAPIIAQTLNNGWKFAMEYTTTNGINHTIHSINPNNPDSPEPDGENPDGEDTNTKDQIHRATHHKMPLIIGISMSREITPRWTIISEARYSYLESDINVKTLQFQKFQKQTIHYMGLEFKGAFHAFTDRHLSLYCHGGVGIDIPIKGFNRTNLKTSEQLTNRFTTPINAPIVWNSEVGIGILYNFNKTIGVYAEPSATWHFGKKNEIETIWTQKPVVFTVPLGIRITW